MTSAVDPSCAQIRYEVADGIATITLNRPDRLNAFTAQMAVGSGVRVLPATVENDVVGSTSSLLIRC